MKILELKNGWYFDENNNSWDADIESLESATKKYESLINCSNCSNCSDYKSNPCIFVSKK